MKINFDNIEITELTNFKGGNGTLLMQAYNDGKNMIFRLVVKQGCSVGYHKHETSSETMYVVSGEATANYEGNEEVIKQGEVHHCPKGMMHSVINNNKEDLVLICVVPNQ